jgi:hypothetical protein
LRPIFRRDPGISVVIMELGPPTELLAFGLGCGILVNAVIKPPRSLRPA